MGFSLILILVMQMIKKTHFSMPQIIQLDYIFSLVFIPRCFQRDDIIRVKHQGKDRSVNIVHINKLHRLFPDFDFGDAGDKEDCFGNGLSTSSA